jgi:hypothetical protein
MELEEMASEEEEKYDNLPESLQMSAKGERFSEDADRLSEAVYLLREVVEE